MPNEPREPSDDAPRPYPVRAGSQEKGRVEGVCGKYRLDPIDQELLRQLVEYPKTSHRELKGLKPASVNNHLILLRAMLGKAHEWGKLASIPKVKKLKNPLKPIRYLSFEEAARLEKAADAEPEWSAAFVVALNTGMRLGEIIALQWDDIDFVAKTMVVQRSDWQGHIGTPKSGKQRTIPLNAKLVAALKAHRHLRGPWIFCRDDVSRRNNGEFKNALYRTRKRAGLSGSEWHALRHTFASHLAMRNVPMKAVQELLGHADMQMTLRYSHLSPATSRRAVEALSRRCSSRRQMLSYGNIAATEL